MTALASLSRFLQDPYNRRQQQFKFVVPQSDHNELPSWFINQSSTASVSIKLDPNWHNKLIGVALIFCFRANPYTEDELCCNIVHCRANWRTLSTMKVGVIESRMTDHIFLLYSPCEQILLNYTRVVGRQSSCDTLEFSFLRDYDDEFSLHAYGIHYSSCGPCGVRLVYEEDIEELKQVTSQYNNDEKDVQPSHSQSISQPSKLRLMGPIRCPLWTGLRGILDVDDILELEMMRRGACEDPLNSESNPNNMHFGVFRNYTGITTKFLDNLKSEREPE